MRQSPHDVPDRSAVGYDAQILNLVYGSHPFVKHRADTCRRGGKCRRDLDMYGEYEYRGTYASQCKKQNSGLKLLMVCKCCPEDPPWSCGSRVPHAGDHYSYICVDQQLRVGAGGSSGVCNMKSGLGRRGSGSGEAQANGWSSFGHASSSSHLRTTCRITPQGAKSSTDNVHQVYIT
jgi:hypothetical protein